MVDHTNASDQKVGSGTVHDQVIHVYDNGDVKEYDNDLPRWWLYSLYGTVVFALIYWFSFQVFHTQESPGEAYHREMQAQYAADAARAKAAGAITGDVLASLVKDDKTVAAGKVTFTSTCAPCHAATGGGGIGPNLTDEFWIHGGKPVEIYHTISEGAATKGMPAWGPQLGVDRVAAVAAYVLSLKDTNVAGGKAPQGDRER